MPFNNLLEVVQSCDKFPYEDQIAASEFHSTIPFRHGPHVIGRLEESTVLILKEYNNRLEQKPFNIQDTHIEFAAFVDSFDKKTHVVKTLFDTWREEKAFIALSGWRNELYPVYGDLSRPDNVAFVMERAATPIFGISTFGCHLNAYTRGADGGIKMWIARRSKTKQTWPGYLDNCVAGGITYKYSTYETMVKECDEEASIPRAIAEKSRNCGAITYFTYTENGLQPETQYLFDLELPSDVVPKPQDGEVECFYLWTFDEIKQKMLAGEFKTNCAMVIVEFMIRHSIITADTEPDYLNILYHLHRRLEFPGPRKLAQ
ncbi:hypothetical protein VKS41_007006 [Umbelopsis sp. WA50703]